MRETTPYDEERARYTREALARLALSDQASDVAYSAAGLVGTRHDADTGPGGRVGQARQLAEQAEQVLISAVVYERERGSSWAEIAAYLGISADDAAARYDGALRAWNKAFKIPYRLDETGRKRIPQLPEAAYNPASCSRILDQWMVAHRFGNDRRPVSDGLRMATGGGDQRQTDDTDRTTGLAQ